MQRVIETCTRVEGHGEVKIALNRDKISEIEFDIKIFRGFESILVGKKLVDVPRIASRICGLCHSSQSIASCKAIEDLYNVKANLQSTLLRRLLMTGELLKSHSMHYFFQSLPDLLNIFNIFEKEVELYDLIKYNSQLASKIQELVKFGNDIDRIFGGRSVHLITSIPGGIFYTPNKKNLALTQKYLQKAKENLEWIIEDFLNNFSQLTPPSEYSIPTPSYLALNNNRIYDRYDGILSIKRSIGKTIDLALREHGKVFNKDADIKIRGITKTIPEDKNFIVGPIARNKIVESYNMDKISNYFDYFDNSWKNSILYANFLRLAEMLIEVNNSINLLEEPILKTSIPLPNLSKPVKEEGFGIVEAPRGTLMHYYKINKKNLIESAKLFIATEFNLPLINEMITNYGKLLYEKEDINSVKLKVQKIIRAFDPCISCATH